MPPISEDIPRDESWLDFIARRCLEKDSKNRSNRGVFGREGPFRFFRKDTVILRIEQLFFRTFSPKGKSELSPDSWGRETWE
ncbi:MAG: hypothetical protein IPL87_04155 [Candidatus Moraniibacteriota bacterium]|nr:MAG: hypothetical protein IPL87_04155 [Candidatus Moranbacteria bacterium]